MKKEEFDQNKALAVYTGLMRLIDAGAYNERNADGSYGEDGIEKRLDGLTEQAMQRGLKIIGNKGNYRLIPMSDEEKATFQAARRNGALACARECVEREMPYVTTDEVRLYQYHFESQR